MNKVILTGNLTHDIEVKATGNGKSVASGSIAVRREYKDPNGEYGTDFVNFVAWGYQADYLGQYARKGDRVEIVGRWQVRYYENDDGKKVRVDEVVIENVSVTLSRQKSENIGALVQADDLPF